MCENKESKINLNKIIYKNVDPIIRVVVIKYFSANS